MLLKPRWRKVLRDVLGNKTRTILVVLSIAVGVAAIGMVTGSHLVMSTDLPTAYAQINPMHGQLIVSDFTDDLVQTVRRIPAVADSPSTPKTSSSVDWWKRAAPWEGLIYTPGRAIRSLAYTRRNGAPIRSIITSNGRCNTSTIPFSRATGVSTSRLSTNPNSPTTQR